MAELYLKATTELLELEVSTGDIKLTLPLSSVAPSAMSHLKGLANAFSEFESYLVKWGAP